MENETDCRPTTSREQLMQRPQIYEKPSNRIRTIILSELDRGYIVDVGCQKFAISTKSELLLRLNEYILEPSKTELKWAENQLF